MAQVRQDPRDRRIAQLEAQVADLQAKLAESVRTHNASQFSLVEDGLRLSQENEALRKEVAALKELRHNANEQGGAAN